MNTEIGPIRISRGSPAPHMPLIFLSHSYNDQTHPIFQRLLSDLRSDGRFRVWYAPEQIHVGDSLVGRIQDSVDDADFVFLVFAERETSATQQELYLAYADQLRKQTAKLIPILIDRNRPIPTLLQSITYVDLTKGYESTIRDLFNTLYDASKPAIASFDLDVVVKDSPIIEVVDLVGEELIRYFTRNPNEMKTMNRRKFEELVAELFDGFGYDVELTKQTRDGGRDIIAVRKKEVEVKYLIECKRPDPEKLVGIRPVRELYGVKCNERATKAILATTAFFSKDARLFFEHHRWGLEPRDYDGLLKWLDDY